MFLKWRSALQESICNVNSGVVGLLLLLHSHLGDHG